MARSRVSARSFLTKDPQTTSLQVTVLPRFDKPLSHNVYLSVLLLVARRFGGSSAESVVVGKKCGLVASMRRCYWLSLLLLNLSL